MKYEKNNWTFSNGVAEVFDDHVKNSVPLYDLFQNQIASMSVFFSQQNTKIIDIGTSTGSLISKISEHNYHRNIEFIGIDIEKEMIDVCKKKSSNITFFTADAIDFDYTNSSVITSMLSLQFIEVQKRKILLNKIYNELNDGGALFIIEKVRTSIPEINDMYNDLYYDFKRESFSSDEIFDKNQSLRGVMKPITMNENIEILKSAGFKKIDVFMKIDNFMGILAIK